MPWIVTCRACGGRFDAYQSRERPPIKNLRATFCSYECQGAFHKAQIRQQYDNWKRSGGLERLRAARQAKAAVPPPEPLCQQCGEKIADARRRSRRFCSTRCRVAHHRA